MYDYHATVMGIHDGDTITLDIDLGFDVHTHHAVRLFGINAPELATPAGKDALVYMQTLLKPGDSVLVQTTKGKEWEKYGRYLATIFAGTEPASVNSQMVAAGHAQPWDGKGSKPV